MTRFFTKETAECNEVFTESFSSKDLSSTHSVYLGIGGNIGDTQAILLQCLSMIKEIEGIFELNVSSLYETTSVSALPQRNYLNGVCSLKTTLTLSSLAKEMQKIEYALGKVPKDQEAPRTIDIDILFYDNQEGVEEGITVPHPHWKERLFVLVPLSDLLSEITLFKKNKSKEHYKIAELIDQLGGKKALLKD